MNLTEQIVREARLLIGIPYRHLGRDVFGLDCLGVVLATFKSVGIIPIDVDFTDYSQNVADYELERHLNATPYFGRLSHWSEAQPGDILLQRFHVALPASHLRIVTIREGENLWAVHAGRRGVVEQRVVHLERNVAAYRLKEVA